jgi:hypothetical protein
LDSTTADGALPQPILEPSRIIDFIRSNRPATDADCHPDFTPRDIRWDIVLAAKAKCREMLTEQARSQELGQVWSKTHFNHKLITFFSSLGDGLEENLETRLRRYSLERYKAEGEAMLREARRNGDARELIEWMEEKLPQVKTRTENLETVPLTVAAYLELVPETTRENSNGIEGRRRI